MAFSNFDVLIKKNVYLDIEINENLSWNKQKFLQKKLSRTKGILSKLKDHVSKKTLIAYIVYGSSA